MIRHVVLFRWKDDIDERTRAEVLSAVESLLDELPINTWSGAGLQREAGARPAEAVPCDWSYGMDMDSFETYANWSQTPSHRQLQDLIVPHIVDAHYMHLDLEGVNERRQ